MRSISPLFLLTVFGLSLQRWQTCLASNDAVFEGVQNDDNVAIRSAVESDPSSLESVGPGGQTPLIHAVLTGKLEAVKLLLSLGADTSATEKDGYDVLHAAGFQGRSEILEVLLQYFAEQKESGGFVLDPATDKHRDGFYPIHRACWGRHERHTRTVKIFLLHGVSHILSADNGKTCKEMTHNDGTKALIAKMEEGSNNEL